MITTSKTLALSPSTLDESVDQVRVTVNIKGQQFSFPRNIASILFPIISETQKEYTVTNSKVTESLIDELSQLESGHILHVNENNADPISALATEVHNLTMKTLAYENIQLDSVTRFFHNRAINFETKKRSQQQSRRSFLKERKVTRFVNKWNGIIYSLKKESIVTRSSQGEFGRSDIRIERLARAEWENDSRSWIEVEFSNCEVQISEIAAKVEHQEDLKFYIKHENSWVQLQTKLNRGIWTVSPHLKSGMLRIESSSAIHIQRFELFGKVYE